jgi:ABC-type multidrug transport system fused ATPase/permease subunit
VFENLTYGNDAVSKDDAEKVLRDMGAERFFSGLPQGLDTEIRNSGESMSQGQMQLICLARALLRDTPILVLDEATASMDPETEMAVKQGMDFAMAGRTCIIIAHRLASVMDADRIAVLSDGVITECGTHDDLIRENGVYRKLFETQFLGKEI